MNSGGNTVAKYACYVDEAERPLLITAKSKKNAVKITRSLGYTVDTCQVLTVKKKKRRR